MAKRRNQQVGSGSSKRKSKGPRQHTRIRKLFQLSLNPSKPAHALLQSRIEHLQDEGITVQDILETAVNSLFTSLLKGKSIQRSSAMHAMIFAGLQSLPRILKSTKS